jgi:hypothetical protein
MRQLPLCFLWIIVTLAQPSPATACTCMGSDGSSGVSDFRAVARHAPLLIAGRVVERLKPLPPDSAGMSPSAPDEVAAIDIEVRDLLRGVEARRRIRVWDQSVTTSCSQDLKRLEVGAFVMIGIYPAERRLTELSELVGIKPVPADYVLGTCAEYFRSFQNWSDLQRFVR